jgi:hypothetical protein
MNSYQIMYRLKGMMSRINDVIQGLSIEAWAAIAVVLVVVGFLMLKGNSIRGG